MNEYLCFEASVLLVCVSLLGPIQDGEDDYDCHIYIYIVAIVLVGMVWFKKKNLI